MSHHEKHLEHNVIHNPQWQQHRGSLQSPIQGTLLPPGGAQNISPHRIVYLTLKQGSSDTTCDLKNWDLYAVDVNFFS